MNDDREEVSGAEPCERLGKGFPALFGDAATQPLDPNVSIPRWSVLAVEDRRAEYDQQKEDGWDEE